MKRGPFSSRLTEILADLSKIETDARIIEKRSISAIRAARKLARDLKRLGVDSGDLPAEIKPEKIEE